MPSTSRRRRRHRRRLRGAPLVGAVAAVVAVGFGLGLWGARWLDDDGGQVTAGPPSTTTVPTTPAPDPTPTSTARPVPAPADPEAGPTTTDPAPQATSVPPGAVGTPGVLTVGYAGQEAVGRLVLAPAETGWVILANVGGTELTWTARSTGAVALGEGTSFAGVLAPGQSGGVPVTAVAAGEGTLTVSDGTASTVVRIEVR